MKSGKEDPKRTLTFLWGLEIRSTQRFIQQDSARARGIRWGMSLDMTGEDTKKTGGTFLIEKMPDPSAIWTRGDDHHTAWGGSVLTEDKMTPHYFNDFVIGRAMDEARGTDWIVRANPYEGGSDHTPFLSARKPGLLLWHFTDEYYHTDGDRLDKVSADELRHSGITALISGLTIASADASTARGVIAELERAALTHPGAPRHDDRRGQHARGRVGVDAQRVHVTRSRLWDQRPRQVHQRRPVARVEVRHRRADTSTQRGRGHAAHEERHAACVDVRAVLVASEASQVLLNERLAAAGHAAVGIERFRPNVVLGGVDAHDEDRLDLLRIETGQGEVQLKPVKPCARCPIPNVDPVTAASSPEVSDTLQGYRQDARLNGAVTFGMNAIVLAGAELVLRTGQAVTANYVFD